MPKSNGRPPDVLVKVLTKHSRNCAMVRDDRDNPWAYFGSRDRLPDKPGFERIPLALYRTADGKKRGGAMYRWITVGCNDGDCPAVIAVRERDLTRLAQRAIDAAKRALERG